MHLTAWCIWPGDYTSGYRLGTRVAWSIRPASEHCAVSVPRYVVEPSFG